MSCTTLNSKMLDYDNRSSVVTEPDSIHAGVEKCRLVSLQRTFRRAEEFSVSLCVLNFINYMLICSGRFLLFVN